MPIREAVDDNNSYAVQMKDGAIVVMPGLSETTMRQHIEILFSSLAKPVFEAKLHHYSDLMRVRCKTWTIGNARKRHGSCDSNGKIILSWRIIMMSEAVVDYIFVHELAHLKYMNHGKDFHSEVASVLPDWKERRTANTARFSTAAVGYEVTEMTEKPNMLYHFTSLMWLSAILRTGHIALTESNLNTREGNCGVVWLTSSPDSENHGLKFDKNIPAEFDKTTIRISLPYSEAYSHWDEWSTGKGMDENYKEILIHSAGAAETHKTWYISETVITIADFLKVENMKTGEAISIEDAIKSLSDTDTPSVRFINVIDAYIANQPMNLQILLLNVRLAISRALPDATEKISYPMPTFWQGRNIIHFAAQKNHLGLYPGAEAVKYFAPLLTGYKTSKGAIQFPYMTLGDEQVKLIAEIAAWCGREK